MLAMGRRRREDDADYDHAESEVDVEDDEDRAYIVWKCALQPSLDARSARGSHALS